MALVDQLWSLGSVAHRLSDCQLPGLSEMTLVLLAIRGRFLDERQYFDDGNITFAPTVRYLSTEHQVDRTPMARYAIFATFLDTTAY